MKRECYPADAVREAGGGCGEPPPYRHATPVQSRGLGTMKTSIFKQRQAELGCRSLTTQSSEQGPKEG